MSLIFRLLSKVPSQIPVTTKCDRPFPTDYLMSAWQCLSFLEPGTDNLTKELHRTLTRRIPTINRPDQLLIKVSTASLNPVDLLLMYGYGATTFRYARWFDSACAQSNPAEYESDFPFTPGRDFAGQIVDCGPSVLSSRSHQYTDLRVGQRIIGATWPFLSSTGFGSLAEYIVCSAADVACIPEKVSSTEAVAVGYAGLTAWSALECGGLKPSLPRQQDSKPPREPVVLIAGATGGVGLIASQLAKLWGARVHVTCPSDAKAQELMKELNVEEVIVYPNQPPIGMKYDIIIDCVRPVLLKGLLSTPQLSFQSLRELSLPRPPSLFDYLKPDCGARYVSLNPPILSLIDQFGFVVGGGVSFAQLAGLQLFPWIASKGRRQSQFRWAFFQPSGKRLTHLLRWVSTGELKVYVDSVFPFDQVPEAFERLRGRGVRGKIVIQVHE